MRFAATSQSVPEETLEKHGEMPFFSKRWALGLLLAALDILSWVGIYRLLMTFRGGAENTTTMAWIASCCIGLGVTIWVLYTIGGYDPGRDMMSLIFAAEFILAMFAAVAISFIFVYAMATYSQGIRPSRAVLLTTFMLFPIPSLLWRRAIASWYGTVHSTRDFLVIGGGDIARSFLNSYRGSDSVQKLRFVSDSPDVFRGPINGEGSPEIEEGVLKTIRKAGNSIAGVILAEEPAHISRALTDALVRLHFERTPVYTLESFYEKFWQKVPVLALDAVWPLQRGFPLSIDTPYASFKRLIDVIFSLLALVILAPLFGIVALIVRLESPGPIIFRQERMGWHRSTFTCLKFRTMVIRDEEGSLYTQSNDSRVTKSGKWLRKMRIDELPQLWNVLIGDMSLIGPRAEWVKCVSLYEDYIPSYHFRHLVKPGITGWAQVNYPYGANLEDAIQKLKYDLYYIRHYSLKLDAMIVLKTIHVIFLARGK